MLSNSHARRIAPLVMLLVFSLTMGSGLVLAAQQDSKEVTPTEACRAVQVYVERLSKHEHGWQCDSLGEPVPFSGLSNNKTAYVVPLLRGGNPIGYVTVSATKDKMPILEASLSTLPHERVQHAHGAATETLKADESIGEARLLYLGALKYIVEFPVLKGKSKHRLLYCDIKSGQIIEAGESSRLPKEHTPSDPSRAARQWEAILGSRDSTIVTSMYRDLDVPLIEQPQDNYCGPASGAMILEFWHDNGYPSMKGIDYYEGATAFVNHLAVDMDTGWYGTMAPEWAAGVEEHANVHAPYFFDTTEDDSPVFSEYVHSIDYGEPVGVMWDRFSSHPDLEWHWTVGRGYSTDEYQNLMKLNDPWDVTTLWLDFDEYVSDMDIVYVEP